MRLASESKDGTGGGRVNIFMRYFYFGFGIPSGAEGDGVCDGFSSEKWIILCYFCCVNAVATPAINYFNGIQSLVFLSRDSGLASILYVPIVRPLDDFLMTPPEIYLSIDPASGSPSLR